MTAEQRLKELGAVERRRLLTCAECGYVTRAPREFHPYAFCVMVKAGLDPWQVIRAHKEAQRDG